MCDIPLFKFDLYFEINFKHIDLGPICVHSEL